MAAPGCHVGTGGGREEEEENGEEEEEEEEEGEEEGEEEEEGEAEAALRAVFPRDPELFAESFPERRRFRLCGRVLHIAEHHGPRLGPAGAVWEAALSLCRFLGEQNLELVGRRVLELGAGTGIVGIFAAMLGAEVTLTDRPPALPQLRENARLNFPAGAAGPRVRALRWGRDQRRFAPEFHLILGSDIVYDPRAFGPLLGTLRHLLVPPARALLSARLRGGEAGAARFFRQLLPPFFGVRLLRREPERDIEIYAVTPRDGAPERGRTGLGSLTPRDGAPERGEPGLGSLTPQDGAPERGRPGLGSLTPRDGAPEEGTPRLGSLTPRDRDSERGRPGLGSLTPRDGDSEEGRPGLGSLTPRDGAPERGRTGLGSLTPQDGAPERGRTKLGSLTPRDGAPERGRMGLGSLTPRDGDSERGEPGPGSLTPRDGAPERDRTGLGSLTGD